MFNRIYKLEEDLEYPQNLHYEHSDYLLAPEKINVQREWLPDYFLKLMNEHNIIVGSIKKLVPNVMPENNYVTHYRTLHRLRSEIKKGA